MRKITKICLSLLLVLSFCFNSFIIGTSGIILDQSSDIKIKNGDGNCDYWALLIGVDYTWYFNSVFGAGFENNVNWMYKTLLVSNNWKEDHIRVLTGKNATFLNIVKSLRWLDEMEDDDDVCLIYYAGHGGYLNFVNKITDREIPIDLPPFDESDGCDEFITTYWTAKNHLAIITDDLLKYYLNRLDSEGLAIIFDSCYSGGMSDYKNCFFGSKYEKNNLKDWKNDFSKDISKKGRVILMSSRENESSYGVGSLLFGTFISQAFQGFADFDNNKDISAEEAFYYASDLYKKLVDDKCIPTIYDSYDQELVITEKELPPTTPNLTSDSFLGKINKEFTFQTFSNDPEDDKIRFGWDWGDDSERNRVVNPVVKNWSSLIFSGDVLNKNISWDKSGVYWVRVKSRDEHGSERIPINDTYNPWSKPIYILIHEDNEFVDQYQISDIGSLPVVIWAQSFKPTKNSFSKIKLKMDLYCEYDENKYYFDNFPLNISLRKYLNGDDIFKISSKPYNLLKEDKYTWLEFIFPNIELNPNSTYYIVLECKSVVHLYGWSFYQPENPYNYEEDSYKRGKSYDYCYSIEKWLENVNQDFCFITYE